MFEKAESANYFRWHSNLPFHVECLFWYGCLLLLSNGCLYSWVRGCLLPYSTKFSWVFNFANFAHLPHEEVISPAWSWSNTASLKKEVYSQRDMSTPYSEHITCPWLIYHKTNTFWTSEVDTSQNRTMDTMSPRLTLANAKLPPKTDSEITPTNVHNANACRLFLRLCATVAGFKVYEHCCSPC